MPTLREKIDAARAAGYDDEDIKASLKKTFGVEDLKPLKAYLDIDIDEVKAKFSKTPAAPSTEKKTDTSVIKFNQQSEKIKEIQKHLCDLSGEYEKILRHGHASYGGTYEEWKDPVDGLYGRRTNVALKAFFKVELGKDRENNADVTGEDYNLIMGVKQSKMSAQVASKVAPKQTAENIIRKRNYELENLVFERLVKGCK